MTRIDKTFDSFQLEYEWLEADGFGGFASGTVGTARTRRYHALLTATHPPGGRVALVNGVEAWLEADGTRYPLTMQRYVPDVVYPDVSSGPQQFRHATVADVALPARRGGGTDRRGVRCEGELRDGLALASCAGQCER